MTWPIVSTPSQAATGRLPYSMAATRSQAIISGRQRSRSTQAPTGRPISSQGRYAVAVSRVTTNVLACRTSTASSGIATLAMVSPSWLMVSPVQNSRKSCCRSSPPIRWRCGAVPRAAAAGAVTGLSSWSSRLPAWPGGRPGTARFSAGLKPSGCGRSRLAWCPEPAADSGGEAADPGTRPDGLRGEAPGGMPVTERAGMAQMAGDSGAGAVPVRPVRSAGRQQAVGIYGTIVTAAILSSAGDRLTSVRRWRPPGRWLPRPSPRCCSWSRPGCSAGPAGRLAR